MFIGLITDMVYSQLKDNNLIIFTKIYYNKKNYMEIIITDNDTFKSIYFSWKYIPDYIISLYNYCKNNSKITYNNDMNSYTFYGITLDITNNKQNIIADFIESDFPIYKNISFTKYDTEEYFQISKKFIEIEKSNVI